MKIRICTLAVIAVFSLPAMAGGLLTNTNQTIHFLRMISRGSSTDIDATYTNPAGLSFLSEQGFQISLNWQSVYQTRNIDATFPLFPNENHQKRYEGKASAPIIPSLFAAYKNEKWTFSGFAGIIGGGGKASFDTGLPLFDSQVMAGISMNPIIQNVQKIVGAESATDLYDLVSAMEGRQYILGLQFGASYLIKDWLSMYLGARMNYFMGGYRGYVTAKAKSSILQHPALQALANSNPALLQLATQNLVDLQLDVDQTGWGVAPIIGADIRVNNINIGLKYEFLTNLNIENDTKMNSDPNGALSSFRDGVNTPSDVPALFSAAIRYEFTPRLRSSIEYHHFFDKDAEMANNKQQYLQSGTNEYLVGVEFDLTKWCSLSAGYQRTDYGLAEDFQSDTSFSCDSYSLGLGGVIKLNEKMKINVGYFWTNYDDYTKNSTNYNNTSLSGNNVYSRTNKVFGAGIDYIF